MRRRRTEDDTPVAVSVPEPAMVQVTPPPLPRPTDRVVDEHRPVAAPTTARHGIRRVQLEISDGTSLILQGTVVIGRAPTHPQSYAHALALPDQNRTLSRDHLVIGVTPDGQLWAADQGSANGSYIARGRTWVRLTPDQRTPIDVDDIIRFADFSLRARDVG